MSHPLDDPRIDAKLLRDYDFDAPGIRLAVDALLSGSLRPESAVVNAPIERPPPITEVSGSAFDAAECLALGEAALRAGEVAHVVLNGGMATRFGGRVKGVVEVFDGKSFLQLKAEDCLKAGARYGQAVPLVLMNSFATEAATLAEAQSKQQWGLSERDLYRFNQSISVRLRPDGQLFIGQDQKPSYHAPGHGDFFRGIRRSGVLEALRERGIQTILFSNVDNLGATVSPLIIGHHLKSQKAMSAELTQKRQNPSGAWDKGGTAVVIDGQLQILESFRFPADFPQDTLPDFSTNNFVFSANALEQEIDLARHVVVKQVDGEPVLQLESIACEASAARNAAGEPAMPLNPLRVPRDGPEGRFFPVKEPGDLERLRDLLRARLQA